MWKKLPNRFPENISSNATSSEPEQVGNPVVPPAAAQTEGETTMTVHEDISADTESKKRKAEDDNDSLNTKDDDKVKLYKNYKFKQVGIFKDKDDFLELLMGHSYNNKYSCYHNAVHQCMIHQEPDGRDCIHQFRICERTDDKGEKTYELQERGEHSIALKLNRIRGVHPLMMIDVDEMLMSGVPPSQIIKELKAKYEGQADMLSLIPKKTKIVSRKITAKVKGPQKRSTFAYTPPVVAYQPVPNDDSALMDHLVRQQQLRHNEQQRTQTHQQQSQQQQQQQHYEGHGLVFQPGASAYAAAVPGISYPAVGPSVPTTATVRYHEVQSNDHNSAIAAAVAAGQNLATNTNTSAAAVPLNANATELHFTAQLGDSSDSEDDEGNAAAMETLLNSAAAEAAKTTITAAAAGVHAGAKKARREAVSASSDVPVPAPVSIPVSVPAPAVVNADVPVIAPGDTIVVLPAGKKAGIRKGGAATVPAATATTTAAPSASL